MSEMVETEEGWFSWLHSGYGGPSPYAHRWVEIERKEWAGPMIVEVEKLDPLMNVVGLYWRPVDAGLVTRALWSR